MSLILAIDGESAAIRSETLLILTFKAEDRAFAAFGRFVPRPSRRAEDAARFMAEHSGLPHVSLADMLSQPVVATAIYRAAAKRLHPDVGGNTQQFQRLEEARRILLSQSN